MKPPCRKCGRPGATVRTQQTTLLSYGDPYWVCWGCWHVVTAPQYSSPLTSTIRPKQFGLRHAR